MKVQELMYICCMQMFDGLNCLESLISMFKLPQLKLWVDKIFKSLFLLIKCLKWVCPVHRQLKVKYTFLCFVNR